MNWRMGVVGYPIDHSLTPRLHETALALVGLEGSSERVALRESEAGRLGEMMRSRFDGLSVTMPLKSAAVAVCDELDPIAMRLGVVNSLLSRDGRITGTSTDGQGFLDALDAQFGLSPWRVNAAVLGAGGAARGIVDALARAGAHSVHVTGRTPARVNWLLERYDCVVAGTRPPGELDLVVNTVPVDGRGPAEVDGGRARVDGMRRRHLRAAPDAVAVGPRGPGVPHGQRPGHAGLPGGAPAPWWWGREVDGSALLRAVA